MYYARTKDPLVERHVIRVVYVLYADAPLPGVAEPVGTDWKSGAPVYDMDERNLTFPVVKSYPSRQALLQDIDATVRPIIEREVTMANHAAQHLAWLTQQLSGIRIPAAS